MKISFYLNNDKWYDQLGVYIDHSFTTCLPMPRGVIDSNYVFEFFKYILRRVSKKPNLLSTFTSIGANKGDQVLEYKHKTILVKKDDYLISNIEEIKNDLESCISEIKKLDKPRTVLYEFEVDV